VAAFDHMIEDLNAQGIEHVLCTGDVTNLALEREFKFAREKFDRLANGPTGVTVIPGNHDAYVAEGIAHFATMFEEYHRPDEGWAWTEADKDPNDEGDELRWPIVRVRGPIAIVGITTSRQTPWFTAYGRIGAGQLARVGKALTDPRLTGKLRIVAIHHPPAGKRAQSKIRGLRDHAGFAEVIATAGADLIVHGHEHQDLHETLPGPSGDVPVRGIASGTYFHNRPDRVARYRIFEISDGKIASDSVRVWNREVGRFEAETGTGQQSNHVS
jgi:3',5'-cyclic AMP phosphodiesterase CpdA